jgi:hypothetical protein
VVARSVGVGVIDEGTDTADKLRVVELKERIDHHHVDAGAGEAGSERVLIVDVGEPPLRVEFGVPILRLREGWSREAAAKATAAVASNRLAIDRIEDTFAQQV